jgi:hypothetical protein
MKRIVAECHATGCYRRTLEKIGIRKNGLTKWGEIAGSHIPLPLSDLQAAKHRAAGHDVRPVREVPRIVAECLTCHLTLDESVPRRKASVHRALNHDVRPVRETQAEGDKP